MTLKQRNVRSQSRVCVQTIHQLWVCGWAVVVMLRLWRPLQQRLRTVCKVGALLRSTAAVVVVRVSQNERKARPR